MDTTDRIRTESHRDPATLEREIDTQRAHIASLVSTLEQRMSPSALASNMLGAGKDGGKEFATNLSHAVRANPVPSLLTAAGMVWLYAQRDRPVHHATTVTTLSAGDGSDEGLRDKAGHLRDRAGDKAHSARDFSRRKAQAAKEGFDSMLEDNPIAMGALGVAAGAMLGAMLPSTEAEDRWMGSMRDRVKEDVKNGAREATRANGDGRNSLHH